MSVLDGNCERLAVAGILPVYNQRETIIEAIESALCQTRPLDELIVVDDGSTDGSGELVAKQYAHNHRVRVIRQANAGAGPARNTAIRASCSPLIAFLDADDRWLPTRIEAAAAIMEEQPQCMLAFSASVYCNETLGITRVEGDHIDKRTYVHKEFFREECLPNCSGMMIRRSVLDEVGLFDENLLRCEDTDLYLRIMVRYGFEHIPEPLVWVRRGLQRTEPDLSKWFPYHHVYFKKHRYTFGRDLRGQAIWRSAYASVLRGDAIWCLRHNKPALAIRLLAKALGLWPFFNPKWVIKSGLEYLLGPRLYDAVAASTRTLTGRKGHNASHA